MSEIELEGNNLGQKHKHYNNLVQDAIKEGKTVDIEDFNLESSDVINLLNIDVASYNKDVQYILKVLTCDDMLYVSRAIKQSSWLVNDENFIHVINPTYLAENIYPQMSTKALCKFIKHIRNHLNNEERAKEFYYYEKNLNEAVNWLPCCSLEFIHEKLPIHVKHIKTTLLRRLCERSITVLEIYIKSEGANNKCKALQDTMFLLPIHTNKYLDLVETMPDYDYPTFNNKATRIIMKSSSNRIIDKFEQYYNSIHLPTFIKYLKQENIKDFLYSQAQKLKGNNLHRIFNFKRLFLFIKLIPQEVRFNFVNLVFIEKIHENKQNVKALTEYERKAMSILCDIANNRFPYLDHIWYQFAPFDIALAKVKEFMTTASSANQKLSLLEVLLTSAQSNLSNELAFLEYVRDKQKNAEYHIKERILKKLLSQCNFLRYDSTTWNVLNDIFKTIDVYKELQDEQLFVEAILIRNVIYEEKVPEIIVKKFHFNSLVSYHNKLTHEEREKLFVYLYEIIKNKLPKNNVTNETEFKEKLTVIEQALKLLRDFKKELEQYPDLITAVKNLIQIKNKLSLTVSTETLFNIKKTWRKQFFEESLIISPTESAIFNALKHDPSILEQNQRVFTDLLYDDTISLTHVLGKIKTYWSKTLAKDITVTYVEKLNILGGHKATTRGLSILLSRSCLQELIIKYAPKEAKISWEKVNEVELSVQQHFAKNMHIARPQPVPETIILFAKGDYLQYALPSLLSIFYNLNCISSRTYIPNLLDAPVSLQKHGIRLAVIKMDVNELLNRFSNIWKKNKNATIRCVMFTNMFNLLCKEKDPIKIKTIWQLIELFLDNLTFEEDKAMYELLYKVKNVPIDVRGDFYMKCYNFLQKMINSVKENEKIRSDFDYNFVIYAVEIIELLDPQFVEDVILDYVDNKLTKGPTSWSGEYILELISLHLLTATNEEVQLERFRKILLPILKQCFSLWNSKIDGVYFIKENLKTILHKLRCNIQNDKYRNTMIVPRKMFLLIKQELEESLTIPENYMLLTTWNLTVIFVTLLDLHESMVDWDAVCVKVANEFGNRCNDYLKEDCNKYFPRIYLLFIKALKRMLDDFVPVIIHIDIYKCLIQSESFIQGYLSVIQLISQYLYSYIKGHEELKCKFEEINKCISEHPSIEVKIHYYDKMEPMLTV